MIEKAKNRKLVGWSFGFVPLKAERTDGEIQHRDVIELDLREVSILDSTKIPAYNGTSIETRSEDIDDFYEIRMINDEIEIEDRSTDDPVEFDNYEYENRYMATRV